MSNHHVAKTVCSVLLGCEDFISTAGLLFHHNSSNVLFYNSKLISFTHLSHHCLEGEEVYGDPECLIKMDIGMHE